MLENSIKLNSIFFEDFHYLFTTHDMFLHTNKTNMSRLIIYSKINFHQLIVFLGSNQISKKNFVYKRMNVDGNPGVFNLDILIKVYNSKGTGIVHEIINLLKINSNPVS